MNPMLDKEFLKKLDNIKHREIYARLTSLTFYEMPIEQIEGKVTGGSINLDGNSSSRRTCNLTMVAQEVNINEFYWGLTHKIKIEIGVINDIDSRYDHIIWFNQGKFIITAFNVSLSVNNYTITVNGKDKMSLINGDLGGNLIAQTDFANIDTYGSVYEIKHFIDKTEYEANKYYLRTINKSTGEENFVISTLEYNDKKVYYEKFQSYSKTPLSLKTIVREMIHAYAQEPYYNILVNDLDETGVELLEYKGDKPLYLVYDYEQGVYTNMTMNDNLRVRFADRPQSPYTPLSEIEDSHFNKRVDSLIDLNTTKFVVEGDNTNTVYLITKVEYGQTAGFRQTDLIYAGELIANVGETVTSVLDKIKNMLGDFEYFYDVDGHFVFQRQKVYENRSWNPLNITDDDDMLIENAVSNSATAYSFVDNNIITAFTNTPNLNNLRNDFSIWGTRKGITGADLPIHLRFAIDTKPQFYVTFDGYIYATDKDVLNELVIDSEAIKEKAKEEFYRYDKKPMPIFEGKERLSDDWWYMSDWYNYYVQLVGRPANESIRLYASNRDNDPSKPLGYVPNFDPSLYFNTVGNPRRNNVWLFHLEEGDVYRYIYSDQHNTSITPTPNAGMIDIDGLPTGYPFRGCGHSFTYFITVDSEGVAHDKPGAKGFFYKPQFPASAQQAIEERVQEAMEEYVNEHIIICDWREIIYQMAKDYYKHNQEDNFYSSVQNNNGKRRDGAFYYPNGKTGYEQYYIDIYSFWRELYDMKPEYNYNTFGGYYAEYIDWTEVNDFTYEILTQWVDFEVEEGLFETEYYLPEEEKIYDDNLAQVVVAIKNIKFDLKAEILVYEEADDKGYLDWSEIINGEPLDNLHSSLASTSKLKYEVYRSFYPSAGYCKVPFGGNKLNTVTTLNYYTEENPNSLGSTEKDLPVYYKIRGFIEVPIDGKTKKIYTQWSNRVNITYRLEYELDEDGNHVQDVNHYDIKHIYAAETHEYSFTNNETVPVIDIVAYNNNFNNDYKYWNKNVYEAPEKLNFWFDFLDSDSELAQYKVPLVGDRTKAVNDNKVTSVYFKETPNIIFVSPDKYNLADRQTGYTYLFIDNYLENMFNISAQYKSAKDVLDEYLYKFSYCVENISITSLPVYYLEPNTRIFVYDEDSQINGEYIVSKITIPLTYNGMMSITATKAVNRIY